MVRKRLTLTTRSPLETEGLGEVLGRLLQGGEVIALMGGLGSGKTCFVRGIAKGTQVPPDAVSSPTFTFHHPYAGRIGLHHWDLYRIGHAEEAEELGLLEDLDEKKSAVVIEWADKASDILPQTRLVVRFRPTDEDEREVEMSATGKTYADLLNRLESQLSKPRA